MKRKTYLLLGFAIVVIAAIGIAAFVWYDTDVVEVQTPAEENTPEKLIERLAVAYSERDWDVYDTVYTPRVQRFLQITCNTYEECFSPHRDSVGTPITHEITDQRSEDDKIIIDVTYTHPNGEWCQTYTVVDTDVGYRVDFSTTPADCE